MRSSSSPSTGRSSNSKKMVSSPLGLFTIIAYTKEELASILLPENIFESTSTNAEQELSSISPGEKPSIPIITVDSYADVALLAEYASERIISGFASEPTTQSHQRLTSFIYHILRASSLHISILASALAEIDEYHVMMHTFMPPGVYDLNVARHLFLAAYMSAARAVHCDLSYLLFWTKVVGGRYSAVELCSIEKGFVDMMGEWRGDEDTGSGSGMSDDSENEGTLFESESETDIDSDSDEGMKKVSNSPAVTTVSPPPVVAAPNPALHKGRIGVVEVALRLAADRLKENARGRSPAYAKASLLSPGIDKEAKDWMSSLIAIASGV